MPIMQSVLFTMKLIALEQSAQLTLLTESASPVLIFKHSTRCSISSMAWDRLKRGWNENVEALPVYYLDLLNYRNISAEIAERFMIQHESPQALLISNGRCIWNASHNAISVHALAEALQQA
jgi:bacillithiol system protein YtxJ